MELTFLEDPACAWCWAFQPVATTFEFEFREAIGSDIKVRRVMGGLRDRPAADVDFIVYQWKTAESVSGMPFDAEVWRKRVLKTTFLACRAVKAAELASSEAGDLLLRRLREAFYTEEVPIDETETLLKLAMEIGLEGDALREQLANGRAEAIFERDRLEASEHGFGFPTILIRDRQHEAPRVLHGSVPYEELLEALAAMGVSARLRRRFHDTPENWNRLFGIHPRLAPVEIQSVTGMSWARLATRLRAIGAVRDGHFWRLPGAEAGVHGENGKPVRAGAMAESLRSAAQAVRSAAQAARSAAPAVRSAAQAGCSAAQAGCSAEHAATMPPAAQAETLRSAVQEETLRSAAQAAAGSVEQAAAATSSAGEAGGSAAGTKGELAHKNGRRDCPGTRDRGTPARGRPAHRGRPARAASVQEELSSPLNGAPGEGASP